MDQVVQQFVKARSGFYSESEESESHESLGGFFDDTLEAEDGQVKQTQIHDAAGGHPSQSQVQPEVQLQTRTSNVAELITISNSDQQAEKASQQQVGTKRLPSRTETAAEQPNSPPTDPNVQDWFIQNVKPEIERLDIEVEDLKTTADSSLRLVQQLKGGRSTVPEPTMILSPSTTDDFKRLLKRLCKTLPKAWDTLLDPQQSGRLTFASFSRICRQIGYEGSIPRTWKFLVGSAPFLTRDHLIDSTPQIAANDFLGKLRSDGLVFMWKRHFSSPSGFLNLEIFKTHCDRIFPGFDANAAFSWLSGGSNLVCLEDLDPELFDLEIGTPRLRGVNQQAEVTRFLQAVAGKHGSLGRAWQKIFNDPLGLARVVNLIDFSKAVRSAGFRGGCKAFFLHLTGGIHEPVTLKSLDFRLSESLRLVRSRMTVQDWLRVDKEQDWFIGMDKWISRNLEISSQPGSKDLEDMFHFLDVDDCGFITPDDIDPSAISKFREAAISMYPDLVRSNRHCARAKMNILPSILETFETRYGGTRAVWEEWLDPMKKGEVSLGEFWGAVKGLGWTGSIRNLWVRQLGLMRQECLTLETLLRNHE